MEYAVECPHCGAAAPLAWSDLHYLSSEEAADDDERAASARMACRSCGSLWGHERLPAACEAGRWQARGDGRWAGHWMDEGDARPILRDGNGVARPWPIAVAMSIWGGYSLSASWADMVEAHLRSRGDPAARKTFVNTWLGEAWSVEATEMDEATLAALRQPMPDGAPPWTQHVTAGVDVQAGTAGQSWLSVAVVGWGFKDSVAILDRKEFHGPIDTPQATAWLDLAEWLKSKPTYNRLPIRNVMVDVGYEPVVVHDAIAHLRRAAHGRVLAVRGASSVDAPIFKRGRGGGRHRKAGVIYAGAHKAKTFLMSRFSGWGVEGDWPKAAISDGVSDDALAELAAERLVTKKGKRIWQQTRPRNELLDCAVYALAGYRLSNPDMLPPDAWEVALAARDDGEAKEELSAAEIMRLRRARRIG